MLATVDVAPLAVPRRPDGRIDVDRVVAAVRRVADDVQLLESVPGTAGAGRWTHVAVGAVGRLRADADGARFTGPAAGGAGQGWHDPFAALDAVGERFGCVPDAEDAGEVAQGRLPPLTGGLVGAWAYDLARAVEVLPARAATDRAVPWLDCRLVDTVVAIDHDHEEAVLLRRPYVPAAPDLRPAVTRAVADALPAPPLPRPDPQRVLTSLEADRYRRRVAEVLAAIRAGEVWQVNLSQRLTARWPGDVHSLYRALRAVSPAPFGAVVAGAVASVSPETFLNADGRTVTTRPIKGTRPRSDDPETDAANRLALERSAKDRAENVMVVDMERNDLGRVCRPGTVRVPALCDTEAHPTVWHLVSTVTGELREGVGYGALLRAAFPCGSVTGTPKVRAMALIDALEPVRRGWYCGAIGFLAPGAARTSVAIRTATLNPDGTVDYGAGGGIVADSDPDAEHEESLDKAAAFLRAVQGTRLVADPAVAGRRATGGPLPR